MFCLLILVRYDAEEDSLVTEFTQQRRILKRRYNHLFQAELIHHNVSSFVDPLEFFIIFRELHPFSSFKLMCFQILLGGKS